MAAKTARAAKSPATQLAGFIRKYAPAVAKQGRGVLARLRKRFPGAVQLVYDNYNFLVVGFGPDEKASHAVFSVVFAPRWISICLIYGKKLPDPHKILQGGGNQVRFIRLESPRDLDKPAVREVMDVAVERGYAPFARSKGYLVIKSISAKQRPRR